MKLWTGTRWILLPLFLVFFSLCITARAEAQAGRVGTQTCIDCHQGWQDNDPPIEDIILGAANPDYVPLNLRSSHGSLPFYTIPEGYISSVHFSPAFNPLIRDEVTCEGCHGSGLAHFGMGPLPVPIPQASTCGLCHSDPFFDLDAFLLTAHANQDQNPGRYFDQPSNGEDQATYFRRRLGQTVSLFRSDQRTIVTRNQRIEECSVCHSYALNYPQFMQKIAQNNMPPTQVSCGACHDSHIPAPNGNQLAQVTSTVKVTGLSGSTVTAVTPVDGRQVSYMDHKPHKINDTGAWDVDGIWTRGSAIARPTLAIVKGLGTLNGTSDQLTFAGGGFVGNVKPLDTIFFSGQASGTANLPADALNPGAPVIVRATFDMAGFEVEEVVNDTTLAITPQVAATATVTYKKASGTGTLSVPVPFTGQINFEIRDMKTNTEKLCGTCHTKGKLKFSAWGKLADGTFTDVSATHNENVFGQYLQSGHADRLAPPFEEFNAFAYGSSHQAIYPFDQSISGTGGLNSLRNKGNTTFVLTQTPNAANAYLAAAGNTTLPVATTSSVDCNQCHHGLGAIDFLSNQQLTPSASVLWGDATVTCITCHDPHASPLGSNLRVPLLLSFNSLFKDAAKNPNGGINKFMDGTDIPAGVGSGAICLFCHQGRESGLTVFMRIKSNNVDPYTNPGAVINPSGISFINPHYLDGGSLLWSRNAWEYFFNGVPQGYSTGIPEHQQLNCAGCHMGEASADGTEGGHTWKPRLETCQTCHGGISQIQNIVAAADYDGDGRIEYVFDEIGTLSADGSTGTGLFGQLTAALQAQGIFYNPNSYPYLFTSTGGQFKAFTTNTLSAAFNLSWAYKAGNCVYWHNSRYVVQILQDSLRALGVTPKGVRPAVNRTATDYRTIVVNP